MNQPEFSFDQISKKINLTPSDIKRFWEKVNMDGPQSRPELSRCWVWKNSTRGMGYGAFWLKDRHQKSNRIAWIIHFGQIPDGQCVCHRCDVPQCVNPEHLFLATNQENTRDRHLKGRSAKGVHHGNALLNPEIVKDMIRRRRNGELISDLTRETGFKFHTIHKAVTGKNWAYLQSEV